MAQVSYGTITITDTNDIESIYMEYAQSTSNQTAPASGWDTDIPTWRQGYYIWQRTVTKMSGVPLSSDSYGEPICLTGSTGSTGATGRGVSSIVTTYCNYGTGEPTASYSGWQSTVPTYDSTKPNYWVKTVITYTTGTPTTDTTIYKDNGITNATSTAAAANSTAQAASDKADDAWNKADNAETIAGNANSAISDLNQYFWRKKTASTNVPAGSYVTNIPGTTYESNPVQGGFNSLVQATGIFLRNGITTLSSWTGTALTFNNPSSGNAQLIIGANGTLQSGNYTRGSDSKFSSNGTKIDLINGDIITKYFRVSQGLETGLSAGVYVHGTIEALDGTIGTDSTNYWEIGNGTDYNLSSTAKMIGHGSSYIQLGDSSTWRLATNRVHTGWYITSDSLLHYPEINSKYWDFGLHTPAAATEKFLYIRKSKANTSASNVLTNLLYDIDDTYATPQWDYIFYVSADGSLYARNLYVLDENGNATQIGGTDGVYLLKSGGTMTGSITMSNGGKFIGDVTGNVSGSASKLSNTSIIGNTNKPVYFTANGVPAAISYEINKSVPSNAIFTDENVNTSQANTTKIYITGTSTAGSSTGKLNFDSNVYLTTTAGTLHATTFEGNLSGTASRATADGDGNTIKTTYLKLSGGNVTGAVSFGSSVLVDELTVGDLVVNGAASFANGLYGDHHGTTDAVTFTRSFTSGTKVGTISINGIATDLYVPTNTNTTYTISTGTANGKIKVTPSSGGAYEVDVYGLKALAYKDSLTKSDVGLGNVDNTADANKVVKEAGTLTGLTSSIAELNYTDGVTSNIQTQLNNINTKFNNYMSYVHYNNSYSNNNGKYYKININSYIFWMLNFTVKLYHSYKAFDLQISGYNYGANHWYQPSAVILGSSINSSLEVVFGYDSDMHLWVAIPANSYTGLSISNVANGYQKIENFENLFTITLVDGLPETVQAIATAYRPWYRNETVDNAAKINNHTVDADVPSGAKFTDTTYSAGTGLSLSETTINHSNSVTAQTTQGIYPIKIDAQGHISAYGSAPTTLSGYGITDAVPSSRKVAGHALSSDITLSKNDVGLSNVINTKQITNITNEFKDGQNTGKLVIWRGESDSEVLEVQITAREATSAINATNAEYATYDASEASKTSKTTIADKYITKSVGTAKGDIIYWTGSGSPTRLGAGTNGHFLKLVDGVPTWAADNNTTYSAGTGLSLNNNQFSVKLGYTTSGNNRAVQADANGNLYVVQKDDNTNTTYTLTNALASHKFTWTLAEGGSGSGSTTTVLELVQGNNITLTDDTTNKKVTIAAKDTTYSAGTGLSLTGTTFANTGVTGVKGNSESSYRTGQVNLTPANIGAVAKNDELLTTNPFRPLSMTGPYISKIDNAFYAANKRWNTSMTNISGASTSSLFDGSYETNVTIEAGKTSILTMDFSPTTYFPGYPYGYILVSFYHTGIPVSVSGRVYCNYSSHGIGWHDISFSPISDSTSSGTTYRSSHQDYYNISQLEITIVGASSPTTKVTQVEMHLDRPDSSRTPFVSKYGAETLYYNLTAPKFIGDLQGKADSATKVGDATCILYPVANNEINFGGTAAKNVIYFGYRTTDNQTAPTKYVFSGSTGTASLQCNKVYLSSGTTAYIDGTTYTGNAATATSATTAGAFSSNASITLTGDTTGSASSTKGWSITTKTDRLSTVGDNRSVATTPNDYVNKIIFQGLKSKGTVGLDIPNAYVYLVGLRGWSDNSGGNAHELAFCDTGVFHRKGATTSWGDWYQVYTSASTIPVANGGTGTTTFTSGSVLIGNGTNAIQTRSITNITSGAVTASTNLVTANSLVAHVSNALGNYVTIAGDSETITGTKVFNNLLGTKYVATKGGKGCEINYDSTLDAIVFSFA